MRPINEYEIYKEQENKTNLEDNLIQEFIENNNNKKIIPIIIKKNFHYLFLSPFV